MKHYEPADELLSERVLPHRTERVPDPPDGLLAADWSGGIPGPRRPYPVAPWVAEQPDPLSAGWDYAMPLHDEFAWLDAIQAPGILAPITHTSRRRGSVITRRIIPTARLFVAGILAGALWAAVVTRGPW